MVLTTVNHLNPYVCELQVEDASGRRDAVRPTGFHKFYSESRRAWVSAETLTRGEQLRGLTGPVTVVSLARVRGIHRVYNMTVEGDHVYYVSPLGVLAHNNCPDIAPKGTFQHTQRYLDKQAAFERYQAGGGTLGKQAWGKKYEALRKARMAKAGGVELSHSWPMYLGGPANQKLQALPTHLHRAYHSGLDEFLPRWKSGAYWQKLSPERQARNFDIFREYTEAFDAQHGTKIWQGVIDAAAASP